MRLIHLRLPVLLAALVFLAQHAVALDPEKSITQYAYDRWTSDQGLPDLSVWKIVQTVDGYLWLKIDAGLTRFDGVRFTRFDQSAAPQLGEPITDISTDHQGRLWVATSKGTILHRNPEWIRYKLPGSVQGISTIVADRSGNVWVSVYSYGLLRLREGKWTRYTTADGLESDRIWCMTEGPNGSLWIGTDGSGINRLENGQWTHYSVANGLTSNSVSSLFKDGQGDIWAGMYSGGVARFHNGAWNAYPEMANEQVWNITQDRDGNLWMGTLGGGLVRYRDGIWDRFTAADGLSSNRVISVCEDREGSLWIGTEYDGLARLRDKRWISYTTQNGLLDNSVQTVYQDRTGAVWIGTDRGLQRLQGRQLTTFANRIRNSPNAILSILQDRSGVFWIGTAGDGIKLLKDGKWSSVIPGAGLTPRIILATYEDRDGNVWIGSREGGLFRYKDGVWTNYTTQNGLTSNYVRYVFQDHEGALWIATNGGGLSRLQGGEWSHFGVDEGLSSNNVLSVYEDGNSTLWIGTDRGFNRYKNGKFTACTTASGMPDDEIYNILEDRNDNLWISSAGSIFRVHKKDIELFLDGRKRFISSMLLVRVKVMGGLQPGCLQDKDGLLWFATTQGVIVVDPQKVDVRNEVIPPVSIERVVVDGSTMPLVGSRKVLEPGTQRLTFHYTALSLLEPLKVRFQVKLEGYDSAWTDQQAMREVSYTQLSPGEYTFRVKACNNDGVWNETGASVTLYLRPYFYQTNWFWALAIAALTSMVVAGHFARTKKLRSRQAELTRLVEARTRELAGSARELKESEERYRTLFESSMGFIFTHNLDGELLTVNPALAVSLGYAPEALIGKNLKEIIPVDSLPQTEAYLRQIRMQDVAEGHMEILTANGQERSWEYRNRVYRGPEQPAFVIGYAQDVTRQKLLEKRKDELVSVVAHELRTPLTSIHGSMQFLSEMYSSTLPEKGQTLVEIAGRGTERLIRLINDLLDMDRIESDRVAMEIGRLELLPLLSETIASLKPLWEPAGVQIRLLPQASSFHVSSDRDMLMQVFVNLLSNAIKYSLPGDSVDIAVSAGEGRVRIAVSDQGPGIPEEFRSHVFEKFSQADSRKGGSGLGLYISRTIVEKLKGRIGFDTETGVGTTFHVELPAAPPSA